MPERTHAIWTIDTLRQLRFEILTLAHQYGAYEVRIFGSVARGSANENSDIDFLVRFPPHYKLLDHSGLITSLQELLGTAVDVSVEDNLRPAYRT